MNPVPFISLALLAGSLGAGAAVERYKNEGEFTARLAELEALGYANLQEDFEGPDWDGIRNTISNPSTTPWITSKRITWDSIAGSYYPYQCNPTYVATNTNWARSGYGIYDTCIASTLRVQTPEPIFGIAFWVDTNPDGQDVGILFPGRTTANDPGYIVTGYGAMYPGDIHPFGHGFVGFIDLDGFTEVVITGTLEVNEEGQLEGATTYGADDFTFVVDSAFLTDSLESWRALNFSHTDLDDPMKESTVWGTQADPDRDGLLNDAELALGTDPNDPTDGDGGITLGTADEGGQTLITLSYLRFSDDPALSVTPELSTNLSSWNSGPTFFETLSVIDQGNGYKLITVKTLPAATPRTTAFARLAISRS